MKRVLMFAVLLTLMTGATTAQVLKPVKWAITVKKVSDGVYDVQCKATIDATWHLYDTKLPEGGPLPTTFHLDADETDGIELVGEFKATTKPHIEKSEAFNMELAYFANAATLVQRVKLTKEKAKLVGYVEFMACNNGQCIPPAEEEFEFELTK
ncbi:MAG: disulfide bond formation protein DsbD [Odoribacteraceae bacterium]|jgi:thiol:disulfide interchange protein DsbD|nr:disulfide bond formation protein DsbD [Odoribacteraceae bacterium]